MVVVEENIVNGFRIVHTIPDMTEEEREEKKKEILLKLYNYFKYQDIKRRRICYATSCEI